MRLKRQDYLDISQSLLSKNEGGRGWDLSYLPLKELKEVHAYLTDVPRATAIGEVITERTATLVVGRTLAFGGNLKLAMRLNFRDNRYSLIKESLKRTQTEFTDSDLIDISDENAIRFHALLYAEQIVFERFAYHDDFKNGTVYSLYRYIEENPAQTSRIMEIAQRRYSLDAGLIKEVMEGKAPALETGIL